VKALNQTGSQPKKSSGMVVQAMNRLTMEKGSLHLSKKKRKESGKRE